MCKAGFAGDDAPRAVFRKSDTGDKEGLQLTCPSIHRGPTATSRHYDRYGSERLVRR